MEGSYEWKVSEDMLPDDKERVWVWDLDVKEPVRWYPAVFYGGNEAPWYAEAKDGSQHSINGTVWLERSPYESFPPFPPPFPFRGARSCCEPENGSVRINVDLLDYSCDSIRVIHAISQVMNYFAVGQHWSGNTDVERAIVAWFNAQYPVKGAVESD